MTLATLKSVSKGKVIFTIPPSRDPGTPPGKPRRLYSNGHRHFDPETPSGKPRNPDTNFTIEIWLT